MRLKTMTEGFGIHTPTHTDQSIIGAETNPANYNDFSGDLYYDEQDKPSDIVPISIKAKDLPTYIATNESTSNVPLPNFDGTIYYGFENAQENYRNNAVEKLLKPLEEVQLFLDKEEISNYTYPEDIQFNIEENEKDGDPAFAKKLRVVAKRMGKWYTHFQYKNNVTVDKLINKLKAYIQQYTYQAGLAFARRIKTPKTPQDETIRDTFIEQAINQFERLPGVPVAYDYIIAPQSSSAFNHLFATAIAKNMGSQLLTIKKHIDPKEMVVDREQLEHYIRTKENHDRYKRGTKYSVGRGDKNILVDTFDQFVKAWVDNEATKLEKARLQASSIKNIPLDKRRYLKIFSTEGLEATNNKTILIIDDNVAGGSTIELIYEAIKSVGSPKRIDIFVPLRLTGA